MENDYEGVGAGKVGRVSPHAPCGLNANGSDLHRPADPWTPILLFGVFALEEFRGFNCNGFDVAIGARLAINEDFELRAAWCGGHLLLPQSSPASRRAMR